MKNWKYSKTIWFNLVMAVMITIEASLHLVQPLIDSDIYGILALCLAVGNTILRVLTTSKLTK